jgi:transcriptional regulator with XRE-family HTH domain
MGIPTGRAPRFSGAKLSDLRARRKLSQMALCTAMRSDLSLATLRRWESDKNAPGSNDLLLLAHVLDVEPSYFTDKP